MKIKSVAPPFKYLPGLSFLNFVITQANPEIHPENFKGNELVYTKRTTRNYYLHALYTFLGAFYIWYGAEFKDFNIVNWPNIIEKNRKEEVRHKKLSETAFDLASKLDGIEGLSLVELSQLCEIAGVSVQIDLSKPNIPLPIIPSENLERFISYCEAQTLSN